MERQHIVAEAVDSSVHARFNDQVLARPAVTRAPVTEAELEALRTLLGELNATWAARVREEGVSWKIRRVKSLWGCCHWRDRYITYNAELARAPRDLVEYVVVHEYTHFAVHNHGLGFYALMDERLPGWQTLRRRLNRREWDETRQDAPVPQPNAKRRWRSDEGAETSVDNPLTRFVV